MSKTPIIVLKEIGISTLLKKFNNNLSLIKEFFTVKYGFDSKNLSRIMKLFREFLQKEIDKSKEATPHEISEIIRALKSCNN